MKKIFLTFILIVLLGFLVKADFILAQQQAVEINFFYSPICPHCAAEKEFLKTLGDKYPEIEINSYDAINDSEGQNALNELYEKYQVPPGERGWVPVTFTPTKYFIGFSEQIGKNIENCIEECLVEEKSTVQEFKIPILGNVDVSKMSLPVLTITIAALDGLNPCAMWVLLFLIVLLINTHSRKRMWLIGGTFLVVSGIVYYLILTAWLNLFLAISYVNLTRIIIGVFALAVGVWQIRNFFRFRPGVCKITDEQSGLKDKIKSTLKNQAERIAISPFTPAILGGVIILALGVNLVEFFCSAGLPAIYTRILALSQVSSLSYYLYLLLYTFIFMLDDLIILSLAVITLSRFNFTEKYNYWSTLIGGILIFILGALLIFKPEFLMFG